MTTRIWIEPVKRPDGRNWYSDRGLLLRTRLGGPDGEILCDRVQNAICETCRVLMSRGITGLFETWKDGVLYACMQGDIARTAGLTVKEPDRGLIAFARWNAFPSSPVEARTQKDNDTGTGQPCEGERRSTIGPESHDNGGEMRGWTSPSSIGA
jgi:hypothetical protein